jgi:hypothetical protein
MIAERFTKSRLVQLLPRCASAVLSRPSGIFGQVNAPLAASAGTAGLLAEVP